MILLACGVVGFGALQAVESRREQSAGGGGVRGGARFETIEERRQREAQGEALREMLRGLKHKTTREKIEAAADAQGKFMAPQFSAVVTGVGPQGQSVVPSRVTEE